jgi:hypothetical protein
MVTGHRPKHLSPSSRVWARAELTRLAVRLRDHHGMTRAVSGMALGPDMWWADAADRAGVEFEAHVPFPQRPDPWDVVDQQEWTRLVDRAARVVTYSAQASVGALFERNRGMVDVPSDMALGVWIQGKRGGTFEALRYAVRRGLRPTWLDPVTQLTTWPEVAEWVRMLGLRRPAWRAA